MARIYFDNAATTALGAAAKQAMQAAMENYGNPSSLHETGLHAGALLKEARAAVAEAVFGQRFLRDGQLIFTASGSEASAIALYGVTRAKSFPRGSVILTTDSEHPSVENNLQRLETEGFTVRRLSTKGGAVDREQLAAYAAEKPVLVSVMLVNNETGARYPVEEIFTAARRENPACVCHTDAVQGLFKIKTPLSSLGADLISVSAHKIHGPKGVGALFVAEPILKAKKLAPLFLGGGQEYGFRSGTENTVAIAGFAAAAKAGAADRNANVQRLYALSERLIKGLEQTECEYYEPLDELTESVVKVDTVYIPIQDTVWTVRIPDTVYDTVYNYYTSEWRFIDTVVVGNKSWTARNVDTEVEGSFCYNDNSDLCDAFGRLYTWKTALKVCPPGFRLPSVDEYMSLLEEAGNVLKANDIFKSRVGWREGLNGYDEFGFAVFPGGARIKGKYKGFDKDKGGDAAYFWTTTSGNEKKAMALVFKLEQEDSVWQSAYVGFEEIDIDAALSVRCVLE